MRVLVDECLPRQLRQWLLAAQPARTVDTVQGAKLVRAGAAAIKQSLLRMQRGHKVVMDLNAASEWERAVLVEIIAQGDVSRHMFNDAGQDCAHCNRQSMLEIDLSTLKMQC